MKKHITSIMAACLLASAAGQALAMENPLKVQARFVLPQDIKTVEQAARYFIEPYGYAVQYRGSSPSEARLIGQTALGPGLPKGKIMSVETALLKLLDDDEMLIIDNDNRLISFGKTAN